MKIEILISLIGALTAIFVSLIGAWMANKNSQTLLIRKMKEEHYVSYMEAIHNLAAHDDDKKYSKEYTYYRDKLFIVASEDVVKAIIQYEEKAVGKDSNNHDEYLTVLIKAIRKDLKIKDRSFPIIYLKK